jgi:hypothetical protein
MVLTDPSGRTDMNRIEDLKGKDAIVELNQEQLRVLLGGNGETESEEFSFKDPNLEPSLFRRDLLD